MKRIAIMGAGSLGTILGAFIAKSGRQVDLIDANKAHVDALNKHGAKIIGNLNFTVPVKALTPNEMEGVYDIFIYMAKQTFNDIAIPQMLAHADENTIICTCQNGIPELAICEQFDSERVLGAPVLWGATWIEPGISKFTQNKEVLETGVFTLGTVTGKVTPALEEVKSIFELMGKVHVSDNLMGLRWCKLLINSTYSGMSTVIGNTFGAVSDSDKAMKCVAFIGRECIRACAASGIIMEEYKGLNYSDVYNFKNENEMQKTITIIRTAFEGARLLEASMLQDLQKGKKCEIDAINGVNCVTGRKYGVPTPINDMVVEIVKKKEKGEIAVTDAPLDMFDSLFVF